MTGSQTSITIYGTRGSAKLSTFVVILHETFVHLLPAATHAHWPSSKDLGECTMVFLRERYCGTRISEEWRTSNVRINNISGFLARETPGSGTRHASASLSAASPLIAK